MTYPGPSENRRARLPYHSDRDMLELEARRGIHAGVLPSNQTGEEMDGATGLMSPKEGKLHGWTAQQPWSHVDCPVLHLCVLCGDIVNPDYLRGHPCRVAEHIKEIEQWPKHELLTQR